MVSIVQGERCRASRVGRVSPALRVREEGAAGEWEEGASGPPCPSCHSEPPKIKMVKPAHSPARFFSLFPFFPPSSNKQSVLNYTPVHLCTTQNKPQATRLSPPSTKWVSHNPSSPDLGFGLADWGHVTGPCSCSCGSTCEYLNYDFHQEISVANYKSRCLPIRTMQLRMPLLIRVRLLVPQLTRRP